MKSKGLLSILTYSDKRKELLFLLREEQKTLSEIKEYFQVTSPEILPRIKEMEKANIVFREDGIYRLTPIGKTIARYYEPFLQTLDVIEKNELFWKEHDVSVIPEALFERIRELGNCRAMVDEHENIYDTHESFKATVLKSQSFKGFSSIFLPIYPSLFLEMALQKIPITIILTPNVFFKVKSEHREEIQRYLSLENTKLYVSENERISFVVTDKFLSISLFFKKGGPYDPRKDLVSYDASALTWGEELFEHYRKKSIEIKTIE